RIPGPGGWHHDLRLFRNPSPHSSGRRPLPAQRRLRIFRRVQLERPRRTGIGRRHGADRTGRPDASPALRLLMVRWIRGVVRRLLRLDEDAASSRPGGVNLICHPERSEAPAERSRRTPCLFAAPAAPMISLPLSRSSPLETPAIHPSYTSPASPPPPPTSSTH